MQHVSHLHILLFNSVIAFLFPSIAASMTLNTMGFNEPKDMRDAKIVIFGEIHGTNEIPQLVGEYAKSVSSYQRKIIVALEIQENEQRAIDTYLSSAGNKEDRAGLIAGEFGSQVMMGGPLTQCSN